jgi:serine/threonine protein phosphatase 1
MLGWFKTSFDSRPPPDTRVYAIGDIHGQRARLEAMHQLIERDAASAPEAKLVVIHVGDFVDRGPDSVGVLDLLIADPLPSFTKVFLKGNHEDYMLRFLDGDIEAGAGWFANGGDATLESYGIDTEDKWPDFTVLVDWQAGLAAAVTQAQRRFLDSLQLSHIEGDYAFVHAGVRPGLPLEAQKAHDLMWIRDTFHSSRANHGYVIVHGHSVTPKAVSKSNRIGIDTGAGYGRELSAVVLSGTERRFLQV